MIEQQIQDLRDRAQKILASQSYWKESNDGSYEMALHQSGYYRIMDQIRELEKQLNSKEAP